MEENMDFDAIIKRTIAIIIKPNDEWQVIKNETMSVADMYTKYAIILAAIPAIAGFIGYGLIGVSYGFGTFRVPIGRCLIWAIFMYVLSLVGVYLVAFIIDALAPSFGSQKDMNRSLKVVIFSWTPVWIAGILYIIPSIAAIVLIASLYSLFLLYTGMKYLKEPPQDKLMGYFIVSLVIIIVVFLLTGFIASAIAFGSARAFFMF
jgi:hypothetical protein